ncbi:MAG: Gfo/Idh/MocA family oxidoreductase [Planctomycetaceae bacterium]|nr:Gfo/Idh/MocA family oxidoreductase [Planctomycetaceae bacterium]
MNDVVRIGVLGTARIARTVIPHLAASRSAQVTGIAGRSIEKARNFAREFEIPLAFGSYEELLQCPEIDAVYIPLPPSMHQEWTCRAAEAGKHVLCEKPLGRNSREAATMAQACMTAGVVLLDGVMWYHTERARRIVEMTTACLGPLTQITSAFTFPGTRLPADDFRYSRELGGGCLLDLGWYCAGVSCLLFDATPYRVYATAVWKNGVDIHMNAILWFAGDRMATFECGFNAVRRRWLEVTGESAALVCDDFTRPWHADRPRFWIHGSEGESTQHVVPHPPQEECMADAFCELVRERQVQHKWLDLTLRTQRVCDALQQSAERNLTVDPGV